ncbi:MAG: lysophospholipid acyltransferase family protein [Burkholderiales bacterium]|nr:1-acyl-sn-glycerol-3-phosphate acyltransferase [Betaproteobacteria bacterium]
MRRTGKILLEYLTLYASLAILGTISLIWNLFALPLHLVLPATLGTRIGRRAIQLGYAAYVLTLQAMGAYKLDLGAIDALRGEPALILAPNHPQLIDALLILTRHPNIVCVMKSALMRNPFLGAGARLARYIGNDSPRQMIKEAVRQLQSGSVLLLFPEGTRTQRPPINPLKSSIGVIAKHARVPVQTLLVETDSPYLGKGWPLFQRPTLPITYRVRLGKRFDPPEDAAALVAELQQYFAAELANAPQNLWLKRRAPPRSEFAAAPDA